MNFQHLVNSFSEVLKYSNDYLMPVMLGVFALAIFFKFGLYFTLKCLQRFMKQFEINVHGVVTGEEGQDDIDKKDFHKASKGILLKSFDELYLKKGKLQRRNLDRVTSLTDRVFLIKEGSRKIIDDTLIHTRYCNNFEGKPDFGEIVHYVVKSNPIYNRVFGLFSSDMVGEMLAVLPNIFVIAGIFGTFIGITTALPELGGLDLSNVDATKVAMNGFLLKIAFAMNTSILGILLSVGLNIINSAFSSDVAYHNMTDKFSNCLGLIWNESHFHHSKNRVGMESEEKEKSIAV